MQTLALSVVEAETATLQKGIDRLKPLGSGKTGGSWKDGLEAQADLASVVAHAKLTILADTSDPNNIGKAMSESWNHLKKVAPPQSASQYAMSNLFCKRFGSLLALSLFHIVALANIRFPPEIGFGVSLLVPVSFALPTS